MITARNTTPTIDVLHVIPYMHSSAGGPPVVVDRFCRHLIELGLTAQVATTDTGASRHDEQWIESYRSAYPIHVFPSTGPGVFSYSRSLSKHIDRLVGQSRLVHLHMTWTFPNWVAMQACRRQRVPYLVMPHGTLDPHSLSRKWLKKQLYGRWIEWPNLRRGSGMIYTNEVEQVVTEHAVAGLPKGYVVPLGADEPPAASRQALAEEFLAEHPELLGKQLIVFLSRLHSKKGLDLLTAGYGRIAARHPQSHLVLVGSADPDYQQTLEAFVRDSGIGSRTTFTGPLLGRKKWAVLAAATCFALPSYQEAFPLALIEALRMGLPVMITRRVNIWQMILDAGAGLECELTSASVADSLELMLSNPTKIAEMGRLGQQLAVDHLSWNRSARLLAQVYEDVLRA